MRVSWAKRHKSIAGNALPILRVKSAVVLIVSFAVQRFICVPRKSRDYKAIIVSLILTEVSCIYWRQGLRRSASRPMRGP
jgi:hypothetical protein